MIINSNLSRDIVETDTLTFSSLLNVNNTTGLFSFGFSGQSSLFFTLQSGFISTDKKVYSYNSNENVLISGQIGPTSYDLFVNSNPIILGAARPTGQFTKIVTTCQNCTTDFNLTILTSPFSIYYPNGTFYVSGQSGVQGIISSDKRFKILSGNPPTLTKPFNFSGYTTGLAIAHTFYINKIQDNFIDYKMPLSLWTSLGRVDFSFNISGVVPNQNYYTTNFFPSDFSFNSNSQVYTYQILSNTGYKINISLDYVTGTGAFSDVWRLSTGVNQFNLLGYYPTDYISPISFTKPLINFPSNLQAISIGVSHIQSSGVAKLIISGTDFREYLLTGV